MTTPQKTVESQQEIIKLAYESWLAHPTTQQFLKLMKEHRERYISKAVGSSGNPEIESDTIRFFMISVKDYDFIINALTNYEVFLKLLNHETS